VQFKIHDRNPALSGTVPTRTVVEVRRDRNKTALTYWYYWDYDVFIGDHLDWEPVSLVYADNKLEEIYGRVHNGLVRFSPTFGKRLLIYFVKHGHTPAVRVANRLTDVELFKRNDRMDPIREKWLDLCYREADSAGWVANPSEELPPLETLGGPTLDSLGWKEWGKHSVYLRI